MNFERLNELIQLHDSAKNVIMLKKSFDYILNTSFRTYDITMISYCQIFISIFSVIFTRQQPSQYP